MKNQLLPLLYFRKKERKSLVFVIIVLLCSSFIDEAYIFILKQWEASPESEEYRIEPSDEGMELKTFFERHSEESGNREYDKESSNLQFSDANIRERNEDIELEAKHSSLERRHKVLYSNEETESNESKLQVESIKLEMEQDSTEEISDISIDPNQPDLAILRRIGVPERAANNWLKYTQAGGQFKSKIELQKIYGLEADVIDRISSHLKFTISDKKGREQVSLKSPSRNLETISINQASALDFAKISGIGPVLSERIIKFRENLGGFHSPQQLYEVYGIDVEVLKKNDKRFIIINPVKMINVNTCTIEDLGRHSYCNFRFAKAVVNYRKQHGHFASSADLLKIKIIDQNWIDKIGPYLTY
ncbi:helix-hairpin-helix domain-containing protein [Portibacter marinus]|uniref:helix-hairpin-helix domain-containing protein n=1 Tax=Portibacter marinus TaxID=2898660 RepID=UPI001F39CAB2|nr:helix-hairpin-helix domain-containing protein [Portibacter marinus]